MSGDFSQVHITDWFGLEGALFLLVKVLIIIIVTYICGICAMQLVGVFGVWDNLDDWFFSLFRDEQHDVQKLEIAQVQLTEQESQGKMDDLSFLLLLYCNQNLFVLSPILNLLLCATSPNSSFLKHG